MAPGRFETKPWRKENDGGGGAHGDPQRPRLRENGASIPRRCSAISRRNSRGKSRAREADPRFWASGISLIAHPWNPNVPAVHMNTRFVETTKAWFGGGADLTPVLDRRRFQSDPDAQDFHAAMARACEGAESRSPTMRNSSSGATNIFI